MDSLHALRRYGVRRAVEILENLGKNNLWKRILKNTMATTAVGKSSSVVVAVYMKAHAPIKSAYLSYQASVIQLAKPPT